MTVDLYLARCFAIERKIPKVKTLSRKRSDSIWQGALKGRFPKSRQEIPRSEVDLSVPIDRTWQHNQTICCCCRSTCRRFENADSCMQIAGIGFSVAVYLSRFETECRFMHADIAIESPLRYC